MALIQFLLKPKYDQVYETLFWVIWLKYNFDKTPIKKMCFEDAFYRITTQEYDLDIEYQASLTDSWLNKAL